LGSRDDTIQAKLDKLDAVLAQTDTSHQDGALLAEMLSLSNDGRYPTLELTPQQRRRKTLEALTAQLGGQFPRAEEIANELFNVAHTLHDPDILLQAHHCTWPIRWVRGALTDAKAHADAGLGLYDEVRHARHRLLYHGHDPAACALSIKSVLLWLLGYPTQGLQSEHEVINFARRLQHVPSLANAL